MSVNKKMIVSWIKKLAWIAFAIGLVAVSVNMFLGPHSIAAGGLTGFAIILEYFAGLDRAIVILVGNGIVLAGAFFLLGREVFLNTVIGASTLPLAIHLVPNIMLVRDPMLSMIAGSVIFGAAISILYANNASSGGTAVPPLVFKKYFGMNLSLGLFLSDGIVVLLTLFVFSVDSFFYAVFSIAVTSITMRYIETGINKKKLVYILSDKNQQITEDILQKIERGVTLVPVIGAYEQTEKQMLMVTLPSSDYKALCDVVNKHDKEAFMITGTVSDVHGEGFTYDSGSV